MTLSDQDPLGSTPLDIYLLYYLLRGLFPYFLLLRLIVIKKWDFKPKAKAQVLAPTDDITFIKFGLRIAMSYNIFLLIFILIKKML